MTRFVVLVAVLAMVAASCAGSGPSLTVYSGRSKELVGPLIEDFEEATGIDVVVRYADSTELAATLLEEGGRSPADVFFAQDPASLGSIASAGMFSPLPADLVDRVPAFASDPGNRWVGVSGRVRTVAYDPSVLAPEDLPDTEDGLVTQEWAGSVGVAPTNGSFLAFVAAKIVIDGEAATLTWLEGMEANDSPTFPRNSAIVTAVAEARVESGLVNHYYVMRQLAEDPEASVANYFFPEPTAGSLIMPSGAGILASSDNRASAQRFVEYLLSVDAQEYFAAETFEYPLIEGVAPSAGLPPLDTIPAPRIDLSKLAAVLDLATDLVARAGLL